MEFHLATSIQVENGPRLFYPHFGFFYRALSTNVSVYLYDVVSGSKTRIVTQNISANSADKEWVYMNKNLSDIPKFKDMWNAAGTEQMWQVRTNIFITHLKFIISICFLIFLQFQSPSSADFTV